MLKSVGKETFLKKWMENCGRNLSCIAHLLSKMKIPACHDEPPSHKREKPSSQKTPSFEAVTRCCCNVFSRITCITCARPKGAQVTKIVILGVKMTIICSIEFKLQTHVFRSPKINEVESLMQFRPMSTSHARIIPHDQVKLPLCKYSDSVLM